MRKLLTLVAPTRRLWLAPLWAAALLATARPSGLLATPNKATAKSRPLGYQPTELQLPFSLHFGESPDVVYAQLTRSHLQLTASADPPTPDRFTYEQRYSGEVFGHHTDQLAPLYLASQMFALAVGYKASPTEPAARIWEDLITQLTALYGPPQSRNKPVQLLSLYAMLRLLPPDANRGKLMELYNAADKDRDLGRYMLQDMQIQTGGWGPEAVWAFGNGAGIRVMMRAGPKTDVGVPTLLPTILLTRYAHLP